MPDEPHEKTPAPISAKEMAELLSTPAVFANKIYLTMLPVGAKLTFGELQPETGNVSVRAAVFLPYQDLISLHNLLGLQVSNLEAVPPVAPETKRASEVTEG